ncbi:MAG: amino acid adenylation domain-containing protein, partial [Lewinella sp.]|nr:amino acid adenylation domain-containing protein [Lewinella sp.]
MNQQIQIAIVGMAGRFPDARNLEQLHENLLARKCSMGPISGERVRKTTLPADKAFQVRSYMDGIDEFDYAYFNIPLGEAICMDPHQRLLLEIVQETIDDAGISRNDFAGSNTAVYVAHKQLDYHYLADEYNALLSNGNGSEFLAARISRQFNLHGGVAVIDTSCSSALVALHNACNDIVLGHSDQALVCGVNLELFPFLDEPDAMGVDSPDGYSIPFSDRSNGMAFGEAVVGILLKPLDRALQDGDPVHAVILSTAVNNNAARAASLNAPDSIAQAEVIRKAWAKAGIDPAEIGFVEAHGSGTQLGDSIEVGGLDLAFEGRLPAGQRCPVSTIKANIGHTRCVAGLSGLVKAVLALKEEVIYPAYYTGVPSPLIDFSASSVYINEEALPWSRKEDRPRFAAVSSMGFSGTNTHVVLKEAPKPAERRIGQARTSCETWFVPVSSATREGLEKAIAALARKTLNLSDPDLPALSYTLCMGREHHPYRTAFAVRDMPSLRKALSEWKPDQDHPAAGHWPEPGKILFVLSDGETADPATLEDWGQAFPTFLEAFDTMSAAGNGEDRLSARYCNFAFQVGWVRQLQAAGIPFVEAVGSGAGKITADFLAGKLSLEDALHQVDQYVRQPLSDLETRASALLKRTNSGERTVFLGANPDNEILQAILSVPDAGQRGAVIEVESSDPWHSLMRLVTALYLEGHQLDFPLLLHFDEPRKLNLPGYAFTPSRCWIRETPKKLETGAVPAFLSTSVSRPEPGLTFAEAIVAEAWQAALELSAVAPGDHFFRLGGDSLKATQVIRRLRTACGLTLDFEDIFDYPVLRDLATLVEGQLNTEQKLTMVWKEVLRQENLTPETNFFEAGGHSLLANQILIRLKKQFDLSVNFEDFFAYPTISAMASFVEDRLTAGQDGRRAGLQRLPDREYYPLSRAQQRLWNLCQTPEGTLAYTELNAYKLEGPLDVQALEKSLQAIVRRYEILRTVFVSRDGGVVQLILPAESVQKQMEVEDFTGLPAQADHIETLLSAMQEAPLDLETGPLFQTRLLKLEKDRHLLLVKVHHLIFDDWSMERIAGEILALYEAFIQGRPDPLPPLSLQFRDYAVWSNNRLDAQRLTDLKDFWMGQLSGELPVLEMPLDFPRPAVKTYNGGSFYRLLESDQVDRIRLLCRRHKCSEFMLFMAALNGLLYRYSGQNDIIVGVPVAGRDEVELEKQVGFFANTLAIRSTFDGRASFAELLDSVKENMLRCQNHSDYPLDLLFDNLNPNVDLSRSPLFDVLAIYKRKEMSEDTTVAGLTFRDYAREIGVSKFDLNFSFFDGGDFAVLSLVYNTDLFTPKTAEQLLGHLVSFTLAVLDDPSLKVDLVDYLSSVEKNLIIDHFSVGEKTDPPAESLQQLFEEWAVRTPDAPALIAYEGLLTYAELNEKADCLARYLREEVGLARHDRVGVLMERSFNMIVALLGVLKAGCAYVPVLASYPDDRINFMLDDAGAGALIVERPEFLGKYSLGDRKFVFLEPLMDRLNTVGKPAERTAYEPSPIASVLYTSGSTGIPKGVLIEHEGLVNRIRWMWDFFAIDERDVMLQRTNYVFDVSILELFLALCRGSRLVMCKDEIIGNQYLMILAIGNFGVTNMNTTPSEYNTILDNLTDKTISKLSQLRYVFSAGEALLPELVKKHHRILEAELWNLYGPTEASVIVSYYKTGASDPVVPIGRPLAGVQLHVVDKYLNLVPPGVWGEICISGIGLAKGYLNREETTRERFLDNPYARNGGPKLYKTGDIGRWSHEGQIEFMGRRDHQVKINGYRVELGEIENAILKFEEVREVAVVVTQKEPEVKLAAYLVQKEVETADLENNPSTSGAVPAGDELGIAGPCSDQDLDLIRRINLTDRPFPDSLGYFELFEKTAERNPDATAVRFGRQALTYRELSAKAKDLASFLEDQGLEPEQCVPVFCSRSTEWIIAVLALFRSGGVYVPISQELPGDRIRNILEDCRARIVLTNSATLAEREKLFPGEKSLFPGCQIIDMETVGPTGKPGPAAQVSGANLAYVIFTSGSTGRPKGAMVEHAGMINHVYAKINSLGMDEHSVVIQNASQSFDISVWQMLAPLLVGGTVVIYDDDLVQDPEGMAGRLKVDEPTILELVPSYLSVLLDIYSDHPEYAPPASLKHLLITGETLKPGLVRRWFSAYQGVTLVNAYGPTEASDDITHYFMESDPQTDVIPLGTPIQNSAIYILDRNMNLCPPGTVGEICVSGICVGRGYLNQAEKTADVFVTDPFRQDREVRMYKTGDLGQYREDGQILFHGRKDYQVKVRGFRIEPEEVEKAILAINGIKDAVAIVQEDHLQNKFLCAYLVAEKEGSLHSHDVEFMLAAKLPAYMVPAHIIWMPALPLTSNGKINRKSLPDPWKLEYNVHLSGRIRDKLLASLPAHMVPGSFVVLDKLPLTSTGKIDRKKLEKLEIVRQKDLGFEAPKSELEMRLLKIWQKILSRERISTSDNFFDIGGHSLTSGRIVAEVFREFGVKITLRDMFTYPTVKDLTRVIREAKVDQFESIPPSPPREFAELSHAQRRMWILNKMSDSGAVYNIFNTGRLTGPVDSRIVESAFRDLLTRHESLRTAFVQVGEEPRAKVLPASEVPFKVNELDIRSFQSPEKMARDRAVYISTQPFDLAATPLFRVELLRTGDEDYIFVMVIHHIIADGWSLNLLFREFMALYAAHASGRDAGLPQLSIQYRDFAAWQNGRLKGERLAEQLGFWLRQFEGEIPVLNLPYDFPRKPVKTYSGGSAELLLEKELLDQVYDFGKKNHATLFMNLLASVSTLLYRYSGQSDMVIGTPVAGRENPDLENQIGLFLNTLAIRTRFEPDQNFWELLNLIKENTLSVFQHQEYPFDKLVDELELKRDLSRSPLFDVMIVLNNTLDAVADREVSLPFAIGEFPVGNVLSKFDLTFHFTETAEGLQMELNYNTDLFTAETIRSLLRHLRRLIAAAIAEPRTPVARLDYLDENEKSEMQDRLNGAFRPVELENTVKRWFESTAAAYGELPAIKSGDAAVTYEALNRSANRLAHFLTDKYGISTGQLVAIDIQRSPELLATLLAVVKTGAGYLPVDVHFPTDKKRSVLLAAQPALTITDNRDHGFGDLPVLIPGDADLQDYPLSNPPDTAGSGDVIYTIFTSGSTGVPKGVRIPNRALVNYVSWFSEKHALTPDDQSVLFSSIAYDLSYTALWPILLNGGCLHLCDEDPYLDPAALLELLVRESVSYIKLTPSHFYLLTDDLSFEQLAPDLKLRLVVLGGEKIRPEDISRYYRFGP